MNQWDGLSNENRRAFRQQAVALLQESGLTTSAFARREKLSPQTLNKWKIHFPGKDARLDHRVLDSSTGLAVHENATGSGAASSGILSPERCVQNRLNSVLVRESFSPINVVPEALAANSDGIRPRPNPPRPHQKRPLRKHAAGAASRCRGRPRNRQESK